MAGRRRADAWKREALRAVSNIAEHLCDTAYVSGDRCTWMGTTQSADDAGLLFTHESLTAELYGGCSGVALFLAEAYRELGKARWRKAALAAMRQAIHSTEGVPDAERALGLYDGSVGVAYAAKRVGELCDDPSLVTSARRIAEASVTHLPNVTSPDVIDGIAGIAPALLALAREFGSPRLSTAARQLGSRLVASATRHDVGWSWGDTEDTPHLTGFAHGTAGVSWSLTELYRVFKHEELLAGACRAVDYENSWFSAEHGNWEDLREAGEDTPESFGVGWCTGAPGVGLSRLRLSAHSADAGLRRDLDVAVRTCRETLSALQPARDFDYSLCHGRAGICELLLEVSRSLGDADGERLAVETMLRGVQDFGNMPEQWPCGVIRGDNPSLLLGIAGIGHFLLRLTDARVPSVLTIGI